VEPLLVSKSSRRSRSNGSKPKLDKHEQLVAKYKVMQVQMQDRQGNFYFMKKKIVLPDPNLPTYVRIPAPPIPRSWVKNIRPFEPLSIDLLGSRYL
jgi:hypothetical protein